MSNVLMVDRKPTTRRPLAVTLVLGLCLGAVAGAAFGVFFGAFASVFHNGPELWTGVRESWGFFALIGAAMGLAYGYAQHARPKSRS
ncbi:MAG: hypothetical protein AAGG50_01430 [Bacteroidota bacterium]